MYSKQKSNQDTPFRIPENYSGNAFVDDGTAPHPPVELPPVTDPPETESDSDEPVSEPSSDKKEEPFAHVIKKASPFSSLLPPKLIGSHGGLLGDIGVEELLIIGILILLSQSETDDDILLLLMLLLFYK